MLAKRVTGVSVASLLLLAPFGLSGAPAEASPAAVQLTSCAPSGWPGGGERGAQANAGSLSVAVSPGGRYVAFSSGASNLVAGDTNETLDVFVRDLWTSSTQRVSVGVAGAQADGGSDSPAVSASGRFVAFTSAATNLVAADTNGVPDVFVHDRWTHTTRRASVSTAGAQALSGSDDPAIDASGRYVAFTSPATNLAPDDGPGSDVFVRDLSAHQTRRVSLGFTGAGLVPTFSRYPAISADGHRVAFIGGIPNPPYYPYAPPASTGVYVRDIPSGSTRTVVPISPPLPTYGETLSTAISADGQHVAWTSRSVVHPSFYQNVHELDLTSGRWELISMPIRPSPGGNGHPDSASLSADGALAAITSSATDLVPGPTNQLTQVYLHNSVSHSTRRISVTRSGVEGNGRSGPPAITATGRFVAYPTAATNLAGTDTNGYDDIYVNDLCTGATRRASLGSTGPTRT
ncbi:MAG TPA: hypothetical protein VMU51_17915 [Mycobacteriales bacterium]|nr:hypothetical protein [Mycobacteriales bacterium]